MLLRDVLQKKKKTIEDAQFIYGNIQKFRFFKNFFAESLKTMDYDTRISLCQTFGYEKIPCGGFVFHQGDASNNKFYVIISGEISIVITKNSNMPQKGKLVQKSMTKISAGKTMGNFEDSRPTMRTNSLSPKSMKDYKKRRFALIAEDASTFTRAIESKMTSLTPRDLGIDEITERNASDSQEANIQNENVDSSSMVKIKLLEEQTETKSGDVVEEGEIPTQIKDFKELAVGADSPVKYQECRPEYGYVVRRMHEGESFGELALKTNDPRSASVFCNTECEFLVITKQQFDLIFLKQGIEKENFLKNSFPNLATATVSSSKFNLLLYSFKTEAYTRGTYLTSEGKIINKEPKIFIISQGECLVEKNLSLQVDNPYNRAQPMLYETQPLHIAVIGKGTIIGEEILINEHEYDYSVKALSETVIAHTVTKKDFDARFLKEFSDYLINFYEKKKAQRDVVYENLKKEHETKLIQYKDSNMSFMKDVHFKNIMNKAAIQKFSRHIHREQKLNDSRNNSNDSHYSPETLENEAPPPQSIIKPLNDRGIIRMHMPKSLPSSHRPSLNASEIVDLKKQKSAFGQEASNLMLPSNSKTSRNVAEIPLEAIQLFDEGPRKSKAIRIGQGKSVEPVDGRKSTFAPDNKPERHPIDVLLKGFTKKVKQANQFNMTLVDVKGTQNPETKDTPLPNQTKAGSISLNSSLVSPVVKTKNTDARSSIHHTKVISSKFAKNAPVKAQNLVIGRASIKNHLAPLHQNSDPGDKKALPRLKNLVINFDDVEPSDEKRYQNNGLKGKLLEHHVNSPNTAVNSHRNKSLEPRKSCVNKLNINGIQTHLTPALLTPKTPDQSTIFNSHTPSPVIFHKGFVSKTPKIEESIKNSLEQFFLSNRLPLTPNNRK